MLCCENNSRWKGSRRAKFLSQPERGHLDTFCAHQGALLFAVCALLLALLHITWGSYYRYVSCALLAWEYPQKKSAPSLGNIHVGLMPWLVSCWQRRPSADLSKSQQPEEKTYAGSKSTRHLLVTLPLQKNLLAFSFGTW